MDFNKLLELLLKMSEQVKENKAIQQMFYTTVYIFGGAAVISSVATLIEAVAKLL